MKRKPILRDFLIVLTGFALLFLFALFSSMMEKIIVPDFSAEAYGDETEAVFKMPDDPILKIYVYEKDDDEVQTIEQLPYQTPMSTGQKLYWDDEHCSWHTEMGAIWTGEIPIMFEYEGGIDITFFCEGNEKDLSYFYGKPEEFLPNMEEAQWKHDSSVNGTNALTVILPGWYYDSHFGVGTTYTTLSKIISGETPDEYRNVKQYEGAIALHISCLNILENALEATATVEIRYTSEWVNAGNYCRKYLGTEFIGYDETLLEYAGVKPVWTVELVEYWEKTEE